MRYEFKCPACGWTGDLYCTIAERNAQTCPRSPVDCQPALSAAVIVNVLTGERTPVARPTCGAKLERTEEISTLAWVAVDHRKEPGVRDSEGTLHTSGSRKKKAYRWG